MYTTVLSLHIMLYFNVNIVSDPLLYNYLSLYKTAECGLVVQIFYWLLSNSTHSQVHWMLP